MAKTPASRVKEDVTITDPRVEDEEQDGVGDGMGWDISRNASNLPADELEAASSVHPSKSLKPARERSEQASSSRFQVSLCLG